MVASMNVQRGRLIPGLETQLNRHINLKSAWSLIRLQRKSSLFFLISPFVQYRLSFNQIFSFRELPKECARRTRNSEFQALFQKISVLRHGSDRPGSRGQGAETGVLSSVLPLGWATCRGWSIGPPARMCQFGLPHVRELFRTKESN